MSRILILLILVTTSVRAQVNYLGSPYRSEGVLANGSGFDSLFTLRLGKAPTLDGSKRMSYDALTALPISIDNSSVFQRLIAGVLPRSADSTFNWLSNYKLNKTSVQSQERNSTIYTPIAYTALGTGFITNSPIKSMDLGVLTSSLGIKPTYTDYVNFPSVPKGNIEFYDKEVTTISGAIVNLKTTFLSAAYSSAEPATQGNGAISVTKALFKEENYGSGSIPWSVLTAPTESSGVSLDLYTYSNLFPHNDLGSVRINVTNGNAFEFATRDGTGVVGWKVPTGKSLDLLAGSVNVFGDLNVGGLLSSKSDLLIGNKLNSNLTIGSSSITFANNDSMLGYIGSGWSYDSNKKRSDVLVVESMSSGGLLLNVAGSAYNASRSISFSVDGERVAAVSYDGMIIGSGSLNTAAVLTVWSKSKGVLLPSLSDKQILDIHNAPPGLLLYNGNRNEFFFNNGHEWRQIESKKLRNLKRL